MSIRILVIYNPVAGRWHRKRLGKLLDRLADRGLDVRSLPTGRRGDAVDAARSANNVDIIIAAGGDGTVNEVLCGLLARGADEPQPGIAFFPMGTANVLAWELALPRRVDAFVAMIEKGAHLAVTPAVANGHPFLLMASAGVDARAVAALNGGAKRMIGGAAYVLAAITALRQAPLKYSVTVDGRTIDAGTVIVTRVRRYGGPFVLAPDAGLGTPALHVVTMAGYGWRAAMRYGAALVFGRLWRLDDVTVVRGETVDIHGPVRDPVQLDGDLVTTLPASIKLAERTMTLIVPAPHP
jgi:YegS/Rv2252/BmrU family lipid kinase